MPELTRDALFDALRQRRHYGTTGTRLFLSCAAVSQRESPVCRRPAAGTGAQIAVREAPMGDIIRPNGAADAACASR